MHINAHLQNGRMLIWIDVIHAICVVLAVVSCGIWNETVGGDKWIYTILGPESTWRDFCRVCVSEVLWIHASETIQLIGDVGISSTSPH